MPTVLVGDIGGTSSRFMLYEVSPEEHLHQGSRAPGKLLFTRIYANENVPSFSTQVSAFLKRALVTAVKVGSTVVRLGHNNPIVVRFLEDAGTMEPPDAACIAVAGPVSQNRVSMTNRDWIIDGSELEERFNIPTVTLVNDFVAAGYGLLTLDIDSECVTLQRGERQVGAPIACIGSGTGLGQTFLTCPCQGESYDAWPTEGGHAELAPRDDLEYGFIKFMKETRKISRVSVERVVSGPGLVNVYEFLSKTFPDRVEKDVDAEIKAAGDQKGKVISQRASPGSLCGQVMDMWARHYGAEAGIMGLRLIPTAGLFLAGGMTPKNLGYLQGEDSPFMKAFYDKGRVSELLKAVPIYAVLSEDIGLRGAHYVAFRAFESHSREKRTKHRARRTQVQAATGFVALVAVSATAGIVLARSFSRVK